jgi:hypothetical protein
VRQDGEQFRAAPRRKGRASARPSPTLDGARIQLALVLAQLEDGIDVGPEGLEPVMDSLNAIVEEAQP